MMHESTFGEHDEYQRLVEAAKQVVALQSILPANARQNVELMSAITRLERALTDVEPTRMGALGAF